jgi:hypothetical protein
MLRVDRLRDPSSVGGLVLFFGFFSERVAVVLESVRLRLNQEVRRARFNVVPASRNGVQQIGVGVSWHLTPVGLRINIDDVLY